MLDAQRGTRFAADIAINYSQGNRLAQVKQPDGKITEVGDLSVLAPSRRSTRRIASCCRDELRSSKTGIFRSRWKPNDWTRCWPPASRRSSAWCIPRIVKRSKARQRSEEMPVNWGFVVRLDSARAFSSDLVERLAFAVARGALAIVGNEFTPSGRADT